MLFIIVDMNRIGDEHSFFKQLCGGRAPGFDKIHLEFLKAVDVVALSDMPVQLHVEVCDSAPGFAEQLLWESLG